ncbi:CST complex subunit Ten1 [Emericellopsis atlantica]|uniref:CST complex subunit Ten1 n=1 Tax=Emericellopsis atlantica TaxID=2614577 RepID=A0A9P7ZGT0_9HYPO|nr:CST complex subunit Ten1 [Emericellopsis atlantica]KAG9251285.1 CST complex subunit Ten1 [Emericellopsis atlantica]
MSRGPLPSTLCLLSSLPYRSVGDKVRFLGCVGAYSTATGSVSLTHDYPANTNVTAVADVNLVLETLTHETLQQGEWVNVVGYVTRRQRATGKGGVKVHVQALTLWSAGPAMEVAKYERTVDEGLD